MTQEKSIPHNNIKNKENRLFRTMNDHQKQKEPIFQEDQPSQVMQQVFQMLTDIKNQNQYLIDRNAELEYIVDRDLKPKMEEGFNEVKAEIRALKKVNKQQEYQMKRFKFIQTVKRKKFSYSRQMLNQSEQQEVQEINEESQVDRLQLETGGESTFMRKLEDTSKNSEPNEDSMRMSLGANLLQMMQFNKNSQKNNKRVRNFNFRCNLQEIDKIIEEDLVDNTCSQEVENAEYSHNASPEFNKDFNDTCQQDSGMKSNDFKSSFKKDQSLNKSRPSTSHGQGIIKQQRKMWGINPRKSLKGRKSSKEARPKTAGGMRLNRGLISKKEHEDPILALLRSSEKDESENSTMSLEVNNEETKVEVKTNIVFNIEPSTIEDITSIKQDEEQLIEIKPPQKKVIQKPRRGMFKAPPQNLIESLLMEDQVEDDAKLQRLEELKQEALKDNQKPKDNSIKNKPVQVNNFLIERSKSRSQSRKRKIQKDKIKQPYFASKFNALNFCDEEDEKSEDENPFQSTSTLLNKVQEQESSSTASPNLFFNNHNGPKKTDTAEFGDKDLIKKQ